MLMFVGGTKAHPGAVVGVAHGPQAAASHDVGAGPVEGSVQVVAEVRTPLYVMCGKQVEGKAVVAV